MDKFQVLPGLDAPPEPASRQKSCNACVRSKRKCDKRAPVCSRCAERDEPCLYKRRRLVYTGQAEVAAAYEMPEDELLFAPLGESDKGEASKSGPAGCGLGAAAPVIGSLDDENSAAVSSPTAFLFSGLSPFTFDFLDFSDTNPSSNSIQPGHTTPGSNPGTRDNADGAATTTLSPKDPFSNATSSNGSMWLTHGQPVLEIERRGTPVNEEEIQATYEKMGDLCTPFEPWTLYDPTTRTSFLYSRIKAFPSDFAIHNATPFLHRHLYKENYVPPCIIACFSTSVMYNNRTESNKGMVFRALQQDLDKLLVNGEVATAPYEKLARVYALFMYQVIRLFDGDVALRAQGERDMPVLERWVGELSRVGDNLGGNEQESHGGELSTGKDVSSGDFAGSDAGKSSGYMRHMTRPASWERWIFAESTRRTILMVYSVIGMYQLMKHAPLGGEGPDDPGPWKYIYRWTLSAPLWEAESSFDFYVAWEDKKPHFIIESYDLGDFLQYGRPDQVDEFGKIILTAYIGQDATKEFLSGKRVSTAG